MTNTQALQSSPGGRILAELVEASLPRFSRPFSLTAAIAAAQDRSN